MKRSEMIGARTEEGAVPTLQELRERSGRLFTELLRAQAEERPEQRTSRPVGVDGVRSRVPEVHERLPADLVDRLAAPSLPDGDVRHGQRQLVDIREVCRAASTVDAVRDGGAVDALWMALRDLPDPSADGVALLKLAVPLVKLRSSLV